MATKRIYFDKNEVILSFAEGNKFKSMNLNYDQIVRIQFDKCKEFRLFRYVPSEKISIITNKRSKPIEYTKCQNKQFFDEYKEGFEQFAKNNRVTFTNNL